MGRLGRLAAACVAAACTLLLAGICYAQSLFPFGPAWSVGDSKIYGVTDIPGSCGPRDPMYATLAAQGGSFVGTLAGGSNGNGAGVLTPCPISGLALLSDGHSGFTVPTIASSYAGWSASVTTAGIVILHAGTNDLIAQVTGTPGWTMDKFYVDFDNLVQTAYAFLPQLPGVLFIANMDPMPSLTTTVNIYQVNDYIAQEVKKYQRQGKRIYLINDFSNCGMGAAGDYNSGGIHELAQGYAKKGNCFLHSLQTLQP